MDFQDRIAIVQQFGRTYRAFLAAFESQVGQPMPRWRVLLALYEQNGESSQKRLVEQLRVDPGALTRQLKLLESFGWIERSVDERDNRITNVKLTDAGRTVTEESLPRRNLFLSTTMSLPDELLSGLSVALRLVEIRIGEAAAAAASPAVPPDDEV
jgi:DNA-binding MarR family transcriptional regulator